MNKILIICLLFGLAYGGWFEDDLRDDKNFAKDNPKAYTKYDREHTLEVIKKISKRISVKRLDNNIWAYTKEFAKRFDMPKRWIGKSDYKGALALAYRQEIYSVQDCGYFQSWDNCRKVSNECVLDVYVPHNSKTIPWNTNKMYGDSYGGGVYSSSHWLRPYHYKDGKDSGNDALGYGALEKKKEKLTEQSYKDLLAYRGYESGNNASGIDSITWAHRFKSDGFGEGSSGAVRSFHRNVLDGIDLITINGMCNFARSGDGEMQIWLGGGDNEKSKKLREYNKRFKKNGFIRRHKDTKVSHKIYPGKSFMQRVKTYQEANSNKSFFKYFEKNIQKDK